MLSKKRTKDNFTDYTTVFLFIVLSGTIIGFKFLIPLIVFSIAWGLIRYYFAYRMKIRKSDLAFFISLIFMLVISLLNISNEVNAFRLILLFAYCMIGYFCIVTAPKYKFYNAFINIVVFLSSVSLIIWAAHMIGIIKLSNITILESTYPSYLYFACFDSRNAGPFWEPGAFQFFINLSLIMLFELKKAGITSKRDNFKFAILYAAIISTQSTTGYLCFAVVFLYQFIEGYRSAEKKDRNKLFRYFASIILMFVIAIILLNSSVVVNKFSTSNYSYMMRSADITSSLELLAEHPLIGYGYWSDSYIRTFTDATNRGSNNSSGILVFSLFFGIPFVLYYHYRIYKSIKGRNIHLNIWVIFGIYLLFNFTECFFAYPVYAYFICSFKSEERRLSDHESRAYSKLYQ